MNQRIATFIFAFFLFGSSFLPMGILERSVQAAQDPAFTSFWTEFKTAMEKEDKEKTASMIQFPLENTLPEISAKNREEFLSKYPVIFSAAARQAMLKAKPELVPGEGVYNIHYCAKAGQCYLMSFKEVSHQYKVIYIGPFGE